MQLALPLSWVWLLPPLSSLPHVTVKCGIPSTTNPQVSVLVWAARARGSIRGGAIGTIVANRVSNPVSMESALGSTSHGAVQCLT